MCVCVASLKAKRRRSDRVSALMCSKGGKGSVHIWDESVDEREAHGDANLLSDHKKSIFTTQL